MVMQMAPAGRGRGYTPPAVPIVHTKRIGFCSNCGRTRECAVLALTGAHTMLCHECLLAVAEYLSGVKWLNNWRGIQAAKEFKAQRAAERRRRTEG